MGMATSFARASTLILGLRLSGAIVSPAAAAPLAYVTRGFDPLHEVTTVDVATGSVRDAR
jgi:hypothetical protein